MPSEKCVFRIHNISKRKQASGKKHAEHCLRHLVNKTAWEIWSVFDKVLFCIKYLMPFSTEPFNCFNRFGSVTLLVCGTYLHCHCVNRTSFIFSHAQSTAGKFMCCQMQLRREYNPFYNTLDTSKKLSIKP